jgi:AmmeMemoRadiSam system protein B
MGKFSVFILYFFIFSATALAEEVKQCEFCGTFYPEDRLELDPFIDRALRDANVPKIRGEILGIISPHAGYIYSGSIAAYSYKILENRHFDAVVILTPSHRYYLDGISIYPSGGLSVPNATLEVDTSAVNEFASLDFVKFVAKYFYGEHSLEVQLPFIAKTLGNTKIVPIVLGKVNFKQMQQLADKLVEISKKKNILIIASSDMSHFLSYEEANKLDNSTLQYIKNKDANSLWKSEARNESRACGINPVITFLLYIKSRGGTVDILKYANSGDTAGDKSRVVGYLSAVAYILGPDK